MKQVMKPLKSVAFFLAFLLIFAIAFGQEQSLVDKLSTQLDQTAKNLGSAITTSFSSVSTDEVIDAGLISEFAESIDSRQVCLSLGKYAGASDWRIDPDGKNITFTGSDTHDIQFFVLCDEGRKMKTTMQFFPETQINEKFINHCPQFKPENDRIACAVILNHAAVQPKPQPSPPFLSLFVFAAFMTIPLIVSFRSNSLQLKTIYVVKLFLFIAMVIAFFFLAQIFSALLTLALLFFFFFEANLSLAAILLGFTVFESKNIKRSTFAVLGFEVVALVMILFLISQAL
ncbi:MAG: hypothetical protein J4224_05500 [Candidatus Diapherotrites archaeon]|uniref:Uncharacterized protein n=1 Tax=Candidatus Iainarchaeum sp. TaxID=3101447 RepID=A0A8T4L036_9ARCH|nr:hypothetical protein [Candidatus Diapherotrites archaeon]